jgi:hypothetical protein
MTLWRNSVEFIHMYLGLTFIVCLRLVPAAWLGRHICATSTPQAGAAKDHFVYPYSFLRGAEHFLNYCALYCSLAHWLARLASPVSYFLGDLVLHRDSRSDLQACGVLCGKTIGVT